METPHFGIAKRQFVEYRRLWCFFSNPLKLIGPVD